MYIFLEPEYLYSLRENRYDNFTDLLVDLKGHINSKQLDILIRLEFFDEFGKTQKLLKVKDTFDKFYGKKQIKKDSINTQLYYYVIKKASVKETNKTFLGINGPEICRRLEKAIKNEDIPLQELVKSQIEYTGSVNIIDSNVAGNTCIVTAIDTTYTPKISLYNLRSGNEKVFKCDFKLFNRTSLEVLNTISLKSITKKPKKRREPTEGLDKNGNIKYIYVDTPEMEEWISEYELSYI